MKQDSLKPDPSEAATFSRRELIVTLGSVSLLAAFISLSRTLVRFLMPPISRGQPSIVSGGEPATFDPGRLTRLPDAPVFIGRDEQGLFALSAICPHLGCTITQHEAGFSCPCHGSRFILVGINLTGPAPRPLPYLTLSLNAAGLVEVQGNQPASSTFRLKVLVYQEIRSPSGNRCRQCRRRLGR
jgi:cytochrome b6-f complex iron-sulfur subunit